MMFCVTLLSSFDHFLVSDVRTYVRRFNVVNGSPTVRACSMLVCSHAIQPTSVNWIRILGVV